MADRRKAALNVATVREQWDLTECIEGCVRHGFAGIAPWREGVVEMGVAEAARRIGDSGLTVTGYCRAGYFPSVDKAAFQVRVDDNLRAIDEAAAINAECIVMVGGGLPEGSKDIDGARSQVRDGLGAVLEHARAAKMKLAIEPLHPMYAPDRCCISTLAEANDICDQLGAGVGIAVDVYHVWWDPQRFEQIKRAGKERLMAFHVCDWLVPTRDMLLDRGMMGDGVADIPAIRIAMEEQGYDGLYEAEIFSTENWWKKPADEVMRTIQERIESSV